MKIIHNLPKLLRLLIVLALTVLALQACTAGSHAPPAARSPVLSDEDKNRIGRNVVLRLQARFRDTRRACPDGNAGFNCNGVILRALNRDWESPTFWNPSDKDVERNAVSFIFLREDVGTEYLPGGTGIIMSEIDAQTQERLEVRCVFPISSFTDSRYDGCRFLSRPFACHQMRVLDIPTWVAHYQRYGDLGCFFAPTAQWFQFSIDVREHFPRPGERKEFNEIIIKPWTKDIPERLPLEALWFTDDHEELAKARTMQESFIRKTGLFIPIVRVQLETADVFFYEPRDQTALPTSAQTPQ